MEKKKNCLVYIAKDCNISLFLKYYIFCLFFQRDKGRIGFSEITSQHHDRELRILQSTLNDFGLTFINSKDIDLSLYDYVISFYGKSKYEDDLNAELDLLNNLKKIDNSINSEVVYGNDYRIFNCARSAFDELITLGVKSDKILPCTLLCNSDFSTDIIGRLKNNPPSILSNQCFGRYAYFCLGIPFYSPFLNITLQSEDMLKVMSNPRELLSAKLSYLGPGKNKDGKEYPVALLDKGGADVHINCTHYKSFDEFKSAWEKRIARVNYENIVCTLSSDSYDDLEVFSALPYKKICFVTDPSNVKDSYEIVWNFDRVNDGIIKLAKNNNELFSNVNQIGMRFCPFFELLSFIDTGKIKKVSEYAIEMMLSSYVTRVVWG